ncbi:hypothetical protein BU15DRAFT_77915 [Melanogaster broomeanus]|nr:hypothetical protein BU15DRAFT_77915 [Melanogaster broomeanus]
MSEVHEAKKAVEEAEKKRVEEETRKKAEEEARQRAEAEVRKRAMEAARKMAKEAARVRAEAEAEAETEACHRAEEVARSQTPVAGTSKGKEHAILEESPELAACNACEAAGVPCEMNEAKGKGKKATSCDHCCHIKAKCEHPGDAPKTRQRKREEQTSPRGAKKKQVHTKSPELEVEGEEEEPRDVFGIFTEVMASLVEEMCMIREEMERANNERANQAECMLFQSERMISELEVVIKSPVRFGLHAIFGKTGLEPVY